MTDIYLNISLSTQTGMTHLRIMNAVEKIQVSLKPDKNNEYSTSRPMYIYGNISLNLYYLI